MYMSEQNKLECGLRFCVMYVYIDIPNASNLSNLTNPSTYMKKFDQRNILKKSVDLLTDELYVKAREIRFGHV